MLWHPQYPSTPKASYSAMRIFLSYSSQDRSSVTAVADDLEALGHDVWFDQELTGGTDWWNTIIKSIQECDLFIFCLTPLSLKSQPCELEREYAVALDKPILPILLKDVDMQALPLALTRLQYVDYRKHDRNAVLMLNKAVRAIPPTAPLPNPLPEPPQVPLSTMYKLVEQVEAPKLSHEQQAAFLLGVEDMWEQDQHPRLIALMEKLLARGDLSANIRSRATAMVSRMQRRKPYLKAIPFIVAALASVGIGLFIIFNSSIFKSAATATATPSTSTTVTATEKPTLTQTQNTVTPTASNTTVPATATPTKTDSPTSTVTPSDTPSPTATATATTTPQPTATARPTDTLTPSPGWTATALESDRRLALTQSAQAAIDQQSTAKAQQNIAGTQTALSPKPIPADQISYDAGSASGNGGQQFPLSLTAGPFSSVYSNFPRWKYFTNGANFEVVVRVQVPSQSPTNGARVAGLSIQNESDIVSNV